MHIMYAVQWTHLGNISVDRIRRIAKPGEDFQITAFDDLETVLQHISGSDKLPYDAFLISDAMAADPASLERVKQLVREKEPYLRLLEEAEAWIESEHTERKSEYDEALERRDIINENITALLVPDAGLQVFEALRSTPAYGAKPIVVFTNYEGEPKPDPAKKVEAISMPADPVKIRAALDHDHYV